jgi:hypothetical protein
MLAQRTPAASRRAGRRRRGGARYRNQARWPDPPYLNTQDFLAALDENLRVAVAG